MKGGCHMVRLLCDPLKEIVELPDCININEAVITSAPVNAKTDIGCVSVIDPDAI